MIADRKSVSDFLVVDVIRSGPKHAVVQPGMYSVLLAMVVAAHVPFVVRA